MSYRVSLVCRNGHGPRYQSTRLLQAGEAIQPADFIPVDDQLPADGGAPSCSVCGGALGIFREPTDAQGTPMRPRSSPSDNGHSAPVTGLVETIFEVHEGESVRDMRALSADRLLIITTSRILVINLQRLFEEVS